MVRPQHRSWKFVTTVYDLLAMGCGAVEWLVVWQLTRMTSHYRMASCVAVVPTKKFAYDIESS